MRIFHPVPVGILSKELLLQEHHDTLKVLDLIQAGSFEPEALRWASCPTALYDRYQKSLDYLRDMHGVAVVDLWPHHLRPEEGASAVYPEDSHEMIREIWLAIMVHGSKLEY